jgi:hypothetical protein
MKFKTHVKPRIQFTTKLTPSECEAINKVHEREISVGIRPKYVYVNEKQKQFLQARQKTRLMLAGRGSGKTRGGIGYGSAQRVKAMPKGRFFLAGPTFTHILKNLINEVTNAWHSLGWLRDEDFVMWKRPPKTWELPYSGAEKFEHTISFKNGSCIDILSMDRPDAIRGVSYDGGDWDEYALSNEENWTSVVAPTLRGNIDKFHNQYLHQNVNFFTSIPRTTKGYHVFGFEEKAKSMPDDYFFLEANAYDNIMFWGEKGIERLRNEMGHLRFEVEVMNRRITKAESAFYHKFEIETHTYKSQNDFEFDGNNYLIGKAKDVKSDELIELSFDFGGWFNCCTAYQEREGVEYCVKEFYQKGQNTLSDLIRDVVKHFASHKYKLMRVWGEPRGHNPKDNALTSYQTIKETFASCGWACEIEVPTGYKTEFHSERFDFINEILLENRSDLPKVRFNYENAANLILTLQTTEVNEKKEKDKSREKDRDYPQEKATHLTDSFDYYIMQKYGWLKLNGQIDRGGEVMVL